ncbi:sorting nexin-17 [Trichogramma pretiosum]|uniref:sorting nexin-17 n=1 Tax=Trichogramma pretiosum TaxID=7493 RepID=UPI0006C9C118|nr:sorting nexin-17 [Trichogramma pretiosum]XP_023314297.1 sorting nexin-17 [Trichogramma pretiosum]
MHFSVPDTQELVDESGSPYMGYNVHINGLFHCTVRYKQLYNLHEQLMKELDLSKLELPYFPPKKLFPLTYNQQEERKLALDRYIQSIGQNTSINNSELLNGFLLSAQLESAKDSITFVNIDVFLMNGSKINLEVCTADNSSQVLKKVCHKINLNEKYCSYFSLFLIYQNDETFIVLRKLQDFESPFITQKNINKIGTRIVLGKWYWDIGYDLELLEDPVARHLLYLQASAEEERGCIPTTEKIKLQLISLKDSDNEEEYLKIIRSLKYYGYLHFAPCICDYPKPQSKVLVSIGKNELNLRVITAENNYEEFGFKVTRMRCWRITTLQEGSEKYEDMLDSKLELSFEYLIAKDKLQWITITSDQAILLSVCLQSMIDELLLKTVGGIKTQDVAKKTWTYVTREGHTRNVIGSLTANFFDKNYKENDSNNSPKSEPIIKKLAERFSIVKVKKSNSVTTTPMPSPERRYQPPGDSLENNAFGMIGDDDL